MSVSKSLPSLALAALLLAGAPARGDDEGPPPKERFEVADFQRNWLEKRGLLGKAEVDLLGVSQHEYVHRALLSFEPGYREAALTAGEASERIAAWRTMLDAHLDPYVEGEARYRLGRAYLLTEEYEKAAEQFELIDMKLNGYTSRMSESRLFLAYAYGKLEDSARALRILTDMLTRFPDAPERHKEMAIWFQRELKGEGTGPLLEVSKTMEVIRRFLKREETGFNPTQKRQQDVVKELDRLIEMLEQKKKSGQCENPGSQPQPGGAPGGSPLPDSMLPGADPSAKNLGRDPGAGSSDAWGDLKDAEREKIIQNLRERFPGQYKELIEQYYKSLSDRAAGASSGD